MEESKGEEPMEVEVSSVGETVAGSAAAAAPAGDAEADDSDLELDGIDYSSGEGEPDEDEPSSAAAGDEQSNGKAPPAAAAAAAAAEAVVDTSGAADAELRDYDEVVQEHERQLSELRSAKSGQDAAEIKSAADLSNRLGYLMAQSEVFTHFLESTNFGKPAGKKGKGGRTRMQESEEDSIMMKQAQTKARVTRVSKQPESIVFGTMRDYQLEGLNWMIKLHDNGINGILADEMGLGKTLQSISLLAYLREARNIQGPHIIIVPKSTVGNWIREFNRWCPSINVVKVS
jgi:SWI/SNF-related matrix-associated actin-dependent regulator of chromatin subfamily A member 5